jgi:hypothetical protein
MREDIKQDPVIQFSIRLAQAFEEKVKDHNASCPSNKAQLSQVVRVYEQGVETFNPKKIPQELGINKWAMARVNMYLRMKCGKISSGDLQDKPEKAEPMSSLSFESSVTKRINTFIDATIGWYPNQEDIELAEKDVEKYDLNFSFGRVDEIYLPRIGKRSDAIYYDF